MWSINVAAYLDFEFKKAGYTANFPDEAIKDIYNYGNTNSVEGWYPDELKNVLSKYTDYFQGVYGGFEHNLFEVQYDNTSTAIINIDKHLAKNPSAIFIYGNTKRAYDLNWAGGHYYTVHGTLNCTTKNCGFNLKGIRLNDSVYNSPAYKDRNTYPDVIDHFRFVSSNDLKTFWLKTGAAAYEVWKSDKHTGLIVNY